MPPDKTASATAESKTGGLRALYEQVSVHLYGCEIHAAYLSDTWRHTLKQKGRLHPFKEMLSMLEVGNRVNSWIDDFNYLNDESILGRPDPILRRLLALGPGTFGRPRRQLKVGGREVSSQFVQQSLYAARIIKAIEARGIAKPVVMEIGGGLGGLARLLRGYYGDRLTYYAVDLPETLAIQEWFLRATYPAAPTAYKGGRAAVAFKTGGLNFINAYSLESQNVPIDVAINIDSMQEMNADAVGAYVRYFERNCSERGLFYFQNHFGHSAAGIQEPSDYPLDDRWTIASAQVVPQIEVCSEGTQLRWVLNRTRTPENPATRRLVLRALWNAFMSGRPAHAPALVAELAAVPRLAAPAEAVSAIAAAFKRHRVPVAVAEIRALLRSPYWAKGPAFLSAYDSRESSGARLDFTLSAADRVWRVQARLLASMRNSSAAAIAKIAAGLPMQAAARSDYWSAYCASVLLALRRTPAASALLSRAIKRSDNQHWLVRFAHLAAQFGVEREAGAALSKLERLELDYFVTLKTAELAAPRRPELAESLLKDARASAGDDTVRLWALARTAARAGRVALATDAAAAALRRSPDTSCQTILGVLRACPAGAPRDGLEALARSFKKPAAGRLEEDHAVFYGFILFELGEREKGIALALRALSRFQNDYFRLGQLGRLLQGASYEAPADRALKRSLALRPGTYLHHDFVGDVYLSARRYALARRQFEAALRLRPYGRHIQAKRLYCSLPAAIRESGVFGRPSDWSLIFQQRHDFYHDIGPSTK